MKRMFTKSTPFLLAAFLFASASLKAQSGATLAAVNETKTTAEANKPAEITKVEKAPVKQADPDTAWKPQRRLWGYAFGDFYYDAHADKGNRGPESNYNGVPTYRNAFQFRRLYLGYDYEITKKFKAEVLLASEPSANTNPSGTTTIQNGDNLVDAKMAFWIKNFNLRVREVWKGTDFVIGEMATPGFALNEPGTNAPTSLSEATWSYRSIEKTVADFHKDNSYDVGAALQGTFDPATKNFGYVFMIGNNSQASLLSAANANTGFFKIFYGDVWGKFLNQKLYVDFYSHYLKTAGNTSINNVPVGPQEHHMFKLFASYATKPITIGAEAYTQKFSNGVFNTTTQLPEDATVNAFSIWVRGPITKTWNYFARFDTYNPDKNYEVQDSYTVNTNYGSYTPSSKEKFYTAGLDYVPAKNIHFMPNVWLVDYKDQRTPTTTGYIAPDHTLVYRLTFFFTFGK